MSSPKELPPLSEEKGSKYERLEPVTVADAVGCQHEFVMKGYEVQCTKCPVGLFVSSYADYVQLTKKLKMVD